MPNWKKVIVSGSDAVLNNITASGGIDTPDITIDDWGSVSASLASLEATSNPTLQDVTDNGSTTTNSITASALRLDENGTGMKMTNVGAFESSSGFHIFSNDNLRFSTNGSSNEALSIDTSQHSTFAGNITTNGIITVDNSTDARLILDRNATSNDSEIVFRTDGVENWSIGTGQVGLENDFTLRYNNAENYFRLEASGNLVLSNDIEVGGNAVITGSLTGSDITIDDWGSVSASLTTINSSSEATTLQDIIDNGVFITFPPTFSNYYEARASGSIVLEHSSSKIEAGHVLANSITKGAAIRTETAQNRNQGISGFTALDLTHLGSQSLESKMTVEPYTTGSSTQHAQKLYPLDFVQSASRGVYYAQFGTGSNLQNYFEVRDGGQLPTPNYIVPVTASVNLSTPRLNIEQIEPDGTLVPGEISLNKDVTIHSSRHEIGNTGNAYIGYGFNPASTAGCKMDYVIICCASGSRSNGGAGSAQRVGTILASWDDDDPINATFTETTTLDTSNDVNSTENAIFSLDTTSLSNQVNIKLTNTTGGTIQVIATWTQFTINYTV